MNERDIINEFKKIDTSRYPNFYTLKKPSDKAFWVLLLAKEELEIRKLTAEQIASIIRDVLEISITTQSIYNSFNRMLDSGYVHKYVENGVVSYEIMMPGKDYILDQVKKEILNIHYFKPNQKFSSKRILSVKILEECQGNLKIVDPYFGIRTLDILRNIPQNVLFLTKLSNLRNNSSIQNAKREIRDFCNEFPHFEFRDYPNYDLHDRYIISDNYFIISGYSFKDLGNKESFAVFFDRNNNMDLINAIETAFILKWNNSSII